MTYKVVANFKDLRDGEEYSVGDKYPHTGEVDRERAEYLMTPTDQRGALIEEATEETPVEETPVTSKRRRKSN